MFSWVLGLLGVVGGGGVLVRALNGFRVLWRLNSSEKFWEPITFSIIFKKHFNHFLNFYLHLFTLTILTQEILESLTLTILTQFT